MPNFAKISHAVTPEISHDVIPEIKNLAATIVRRFEGGVNQGLLPMTISDEENNLFCACHLLNFDKGQGQ
jgi:hypothetical protein